MASSEAWDRSESEEDQDRVKACSYAVGDQTVEDLAEVNSGEILDNIRAEKLRKKNRTVEIVIAAAFTVIFGVGNRVLYKLALIPLKRYPFFLAQLATFGYLPPFFSPFLLLLLHCFLLLISKYNEIYSSSYFLEVNSNIICRLL